MVERTHRHALQGYYTAIIIVVVIVVIIIVIITIMIMIVSNIIFES